MSVLQGKKILLGISGGIAAYKTANLVRLFIKLGAEVQVVMTPSAKDFITPLTLGTLSKREVFSAFYEPDDENAKWNNHVELALWADLMLIAPATANTISKMANGACDNLLMATYLSAKCKVYFAPAMDLDMYKHASTHENFRKLKSFGNVMIPAESGELASGLSGEGRMAEPENIIRFIEEDLIKNLPLKGKKHSLQQDLPTNRLTLSDLLETILREKWGFDIAKALADLGAEVTLVSGPTHLTVQHSGINLVRVLSAENMYQACHQVYKNTDIVVPRQQYPITDPNTLQSRKSKSQKRI